MVECSHETVVQLRDVSKIYQMGEVDVPVLHDVNLDIHSGEMMVIVGPSGSGKSTLLNLIGGIDTPTAGEIRYDGQDLAAMNDRQRTEYRRAHVGFIFQFYNLVPNLTAWENVLVSTQISENPMDAREALELVGLSDRLTHFPAQLSGGEQQRVAIARALAKNPALLLCDEPTGALDLPVARLVLGLLTKLSRDYGKTVVLITHNHPISHLADRVVRLGNGTIVEAAVNPQPIDAEEVSW